MIPPPLNPGDPLYAAWLNQLRDAVLAEIVGDGDVVVRRAGSRLTVGLARRIPGVGQTIRAFRITDATQDGSNMRWVYTGTEIYKATAGYGGWEDKSGGLSGVSLYNMTEDQQTGDVTAGGTNTAGQDFPAGVTAQPIQDGTRVYAKRERLPDGTVEWWIIGLHTMFDGTCAES